MAWDPLIVATAAVAFLAAGLVKGVIGMGLPTTSVAILSTVIDLRLAVPLIVVPAVVTNLWQAARGGMFMEMLRRHWLLNTGVVAGTWLGTALLFAVRPSVLLTVLGVMVVCYAAINLFSFTITVPAKSERPLAPAVGLVSGMLTGTTGSVGIPVAIFLQAIGLEKDAFVRAIALSFLIAAGILGLALVQQGGLSRSGALLSAAGLVPAFAGMYAGQVMRDRLSQERFRAVVMIFLIVIGLNLVRKALF